MASSTWGGLHPSAQSCACALLLVRYFVVSVLFPSLLFSVLPSSFPFSLSSVQSVFAEFVVDIYSKFWWALVPMGLPKLYQASKQSWSEVILR